MFQDPRIFVSNILLGLFLLIVLVIQSKMRNMQNKVKYKEEFFIYRSCETVAIVGYLRHICQTDWATLTFQLSYYPCQASSQI